MSGTSLSRGKSVAHRRTKPATRPESPSPSPGRWSRRPALGEVRRVSRPWASSQSCAMDEQEHGFCRKSPEPVEAGLSNSSPSSVNYFRSSAPQAPRRPGTIPSGIFAPTASGSLPGRPKSRRALPAPRRRSPSCGAVAPPADSPSRCASPRQRCAIATAGRPGGGPPTTPGGPPTPEGSPVGGQHPLAELQAQRRRDSAFREKVLLAYEYRCCVCGHDLRTCGHEGVATSGARSRAHQVVPGARAGRGAERPRARARCTTRSSTSARSPCCRGATRSCSAATYTLTGGDDTKAKLLAHHGAGLIQPQGRECLPHAEFLAWHRAEVFKGPARK